MYPFIKKPALKQTLACLSLLTLLAVNSATGATVKAVTGQLSLMATLEGKPAFRSVLWKLTPRFSTNDVSPIRIRKHAATLDLAPGSYQVSVSMGSKTHTYQVIIKESSKQTLIVDLD